MSLSAALMAVGIAAAVLSRQQVPTPPPMADRSSPAYCPVSDDPTYGLTRENPVQVGGGAMYGPARERRFLDALRATYMGEPGHLAQAAIDAVDRWRSEPPRVNGAPVARGVIVQVKLRP